MGREKNQHGVSEARRKHRRRWFATGRLRQAALIAGCVLLFMHNLARAAPHQPDAKAAALAAARRIELAAKKGIGYRDFGRLAETTDAALQRYVATEPGRGEIDREMIADAAKATIRTVKASLDVWGLRYADCGQGGPKGAQDATCDIVILNTNGQDLSAKGPDWVRKMAARAALLYDRLDEFPNPGGGMRTGEVLKKAFHDDPKAGFPFHVPGYKTMRAIQISHLVPALLSWDAGSADLFIKTVDMASK